jgi:hypothetical protein
MILSLLLSFLDLIPWLRMYSLLWRNTLRLFPLVLGVLLQHYYQYSKFVKDTAAVPLRRKELIYDEVLSA